MNTCLTIGERLKDLRVERGLTLKQLAEETNISHSALGKYESDTARDISPYNLAKLAKFYNVSMDYLTQLSEQRDHPNTPIECLHISDDMIKLLQSQKLNNRLLGEIVTQEDFKTLLMDAEIYIDRIVETEIAKGNAILAFARNQVIEKHHVENDVNLRSLELSQIDEKEILRNVIHKEIDRILDTIRETHANDTTSGVPDFNLEGLNTMFENALGIVNK